jgi:hypothetical protein
MIPENPTEAEAKATLMGNDHPLDYCESLTQSHDFYVQASMILWQEFWNNWSRKTTPFHIDRRKSN